jgi:hypothetical protein
LAELPQDSRKHNSLFQLVFTTKIFLNKQTYHPLKQKKGTEIERKNKREG